jgi:hypothetical protein
VTGPGADHPLVGTWRLLTWAAVADDGGETLPMGPAPEGLLVYSANGTMIAMMGPGGRRRFGSDEVTGGTPDEQAEAFRTFIAYGGAYEIEGSIVTHLVEHSLFPNWIGTSQRRQWELDDQGERLTLRSPPLVLGGAARRQRLVWQRVRR